MMEASLQVPKKKRLLIWDYFVVSDDGRLAKCCSCKLKISRCGKDRKTYGTTNLSTYLRMQTSIIAKGFEQKQRIEVSCSSAKRKFGHEEMLTFAK